MKHPWVIVLVVAIILASVAVFAYRRWTANAASAANVQTVPVERANIVALVNAAGNVTAPEDAQLAFQTTGTVAQVNVEDGDQVKKGQVLMQLDTTDLELALRTAQANAVSAQANYDAAKATDATNADQLVVAQANLDKSRTALEQAQAAYNQVAWRANIGMLPQSIALQQATDDYDSALATYNETVATITHDALKSAQASLEQAQIAVKQAQQNLDNADLVAPFDGSIAAVNYQVGDSVGASPAVELVNLSTLEVDATLSEIDVPKVEPGQTAQMTLDALPGETYTAAVMGIGPAGTVTQGVVNFPVTFRVSNATGEIKPGMTANLNIAVARADNVLMVPTRAVHTQGNQKIVTVLNKGQGIAVPIETGLSNDQEIEVTRGLTQGEQVVLNPALDTGPRSRGGFFGLGG